VESPGSTLKLQGDINGMQNQHRQTKQDPSPQIWAVGGGKGGIGKSVLSILISMALARTGKETVVIDGDLGGANLHTFMGIRTPVRTLNDFINRRYDSLNDVGAGTGFNTLDFFLSAHHQIVVMTPQPVAIQNAYAFVRNAVYRTLSRLTNQRPSLKDLVRTAMDPKNHRQVKTVNHLLERVENNGNPAEAAQMASHLSRIRPILITNMAREPRDKNASRIIQMVSQKHLMIQAHNGGGIYFDPQINAMVSAMEPLTRVDHDSSAIQSSRSIVSHLKRAA
jgi:flagellar biosynthesis protein FlhG